MISFFMLIVTCYVSRIFFSRKDAKLAKEQSKIVSSIKLCCFANFAALREMVFHLQKYKENMRA